jgi:hypothetical protein
MDDGFGHWLAGFIDGEGCFEVYRNAAGWYCCRFTLNVRADDERILLEIQRRAGVGIVQAKRLAHRGDGADRKPQVRWVVINKPDCIGLVALLDRYPLRAKKARDYAIWREAVSEWSRIRRHSGKQDWTKMPVAAVDDPQLDMAL